MKRLIISIALILSACTPNVAEHKESTKLSTNDPKINLSTTQLPTFTPIIKSLPTITPTIKPTKTMTPVPTPVGGGGKLVFTIPDWKFLKSFPDLPGIFNIFWADPENGQLMPITKGPKGIANLLQGGLTDGSKLLYVSAPETKNIFDYYKYKKFDLWAINSDGTNPFMVSGGKVKTYLLGNQWLKDGSIIFTGWDQDGLGLFHVLADGSGLKRINKPVGAATDKAVILFLDPDQRGAYWLAGERYIWTSLDGSSQHQVWSNTVIDAANSIQISPNGQWIIFNRYSGSGSQFKQKNGCYVATIEGKDVKRVGENCLLGSSNHYLIWSPDSHGFIYWNADNNQKKYLLFFYSVTDGSSTPLADIGTASCSFGEWLNNGTQLFLDNCRSNFGGYDVEDAPRILNIENGKVTVYNNFGQCQHQFSTDGKEIFFFDCVKLIFSPNFTSSAATYHLMNLETGKDSLLFKDQLSESENDWRILSFGIWANPSIKR